MKKLLVIFLGALLMITALACAPSEADEGIKSKISELRIVVYEASDEEISVSFTSGKREEPFAADGVHNSMQEFGVLSVQPKAGGAGEWSYVLKSQSGDYSGKLALHPFGMSYEADLKKQIDGNIVVVINGPNNFSKEMTLESKRTSDMISWEQALNIAANKMNGKIDDMYENEQFNGEVYIRFVGNMTDMDKSYYWYVAFISSSQTKAVLINPLSGDVAAMN